MNAVGAHEDAPDLALDPRLDLLKIRTPHALGFIVRVAHVVADRVALAADSTHSCHGFFYASFRFSR